MVQKESNDCQTSQELTRVMDLSIWTKNTNQEALHITHKTQHKD